MECQYCGKTFSTKTNLNQHQRKTKYCLKIQGEVPDESYTCIYCNKFFTHKNNYSYHIRTHEKDCDFMNVWKELEALRFLNRNLESMIDIERREIQLLRQQLVEKNTGNTDLKDRIERIATKPTTVTNTNTINYNYTQILKRRNTLSSSHTNELIECISPDLIETKGQDMIRVWGRVFADIIGDSVVPRDTSRGKSVCKLDEPMAIEMNIQKRNNLFLLHDNSFLNDTIRSLITPLTADTIKNIIFSYSETRKTVRSMEDMLHYTRVIKMFNKLKEGIVNDDMNGVAKHALTLLPTP